MKSYRLEAFDLAALELVEIAAPRPGAGEVVVEVRALSLNFRDYLVATGKYNPHFELPAVPLSDAAGVVREVGEGVTDLEPGQPVVSHFVSGWQDGPFHQDYLGTTLGLPGPGVASELVRLPATAVVPIPESLAFEAAATLPIAALTAWSALVTEGELDQPRGESARVLTLGTGGVSIFAVQLGRALGAEMWVTSSDDAKISRAIDLGAHAGINYREYPEWDRELRKRTDGLGVDLVVENGGVGTLGRSLSAVAAGGRIALLGALTGLRGTVDIAPILMKRIRVAGIMVDCRRRFEELLRFVTEHRIEPVIDSRRPFEELPAALADLAEGRHFGKIVVTVP